MNASDPGQGSVLINPIGVVESELKSPSQKYEYDREVCIRILPALEPGLLGIEYFSHLWVVYHQHRSGEWLREKGWGDQAPITLPWCDDRSGQGVFSSRAPCRPACLGSCIVRLVRREGAVLVVRGLDAFDRTPVLDVKPYVPQFDAFPQAVVPMDWAKVLDREDDLSHVSQEFHWDTTNVEFALGLRAGLAVLARLVLRRGANLKATVEGSLFFAQGFEMATGCSPLRGRLEWRARAAEAGPWRVVFAVGKMSGGLVLGRIDWADSGAVMGAAESELFEPGTGT